MGYGEIMVGHGSQGQHMSRRIRRVMSNRGGHEGVPGVIERKGFIFQFLIVFLNQSINFVLCFELPLKNKIQS